MCPVVLTASASLPRLQLTGTIRFGWGATVLFRAERNRDAALWRHALRDLFAPPREVPNRDYEGRHEARPFPTPENGLTFDDLVEWLRLPKVMKRPKHIRAIMADLVALGMIRVVNGRYFANDLLFYSGPTEDELIDPRPLVRRRANACPSCGGYLTECSGCWLCDGSGFMHGNGCGYRIDKPYERFICRHCGKFRRGHAASRTGMVIGDACSVKDHRDRQQHCQNLPTTDVPQRTPETIGSYKTGLDAWNKPNTFLCCPYCRSSEIFGTRYGNRAYLTPDDAGLIWCDSSLCRLPFYLPDTEPSS